MYDGNEKETDQEFYVLQEAWFESSHSPCEVVALSTVKCVRTFEQELGTG